MLIDGIGISGFRSFYDDIQLLGPFSKINLFIGQNNSGKSNILLFISKHYKKNIEAINNPKLALDLQNIDRPINDATAKIKLAFLLLPNGEPYNSLINRCRSKNGSTQTLKQIFNLLFVPEGSNHIWLTFETQWGKSLTLSHLNILKIDKKKLSNNEWYHLWSQLTSQEKGDIDQHWIPETINWIYRNAELISPKINFIPAIRSINKGSINEDDFSGVGIIDRLAKLQNPDYHEQTLKADFEKINVFLRNVTGNETATIEIPYERDKILVHMDEKPLPLSSLGTGIHEVLILASAATVLQNQVICIEEPELNLHPTLQKKLIQYLSDHTNNQYFISTHSAHLLDIPDVSIFHVELENNHSIVTHVANDAEKFLICSDLGYKASDLLQANCIIWVEGPSDRIYLNHWIKAIDPNLKEGINYSIMFYGGRLLSHLTADDSEVDEFISLRRLNRNICILIDSDRSNPYVRINATKRRLIEEFNKGPGFAWLSKGREIENYIDAYQLEKAVVSLHPMAIGLEKKEYMTIALNTT